MRPRRSKPLYRGSAGHANEAASPPDEQGAERGAEAEARTAMTDALAPTLDVLYATFHNLTQVSGELLAAPERVAELDSGWRRLRADLGDTSGVDIPDSDP